MPQWWIPVMLSLLGQQALIRTMTMVSMWLILGTNVSSMAGKVVAERMEPRTWAN